MKCRCKICKQSRHFQRVIKRRNTEELIAAVNELYEQLHNEGMDSDYYRAILDGSWPTSVEILERSLENAKKMPA